MVKLWGELNMSQKDVKKLYPKLYGKIRQDMVNQIYNKGAETKGVKGAESIPPKLLTGMYDEIYKNMAKTGDIKKKYGGSMKKMKDGKKVGSTPVPKRFTKALDDKYRHKSEIYGMILSPSGKKSTRKRTTIEKIFGGGPNDLYNRQTNEAKKAGKKAAGYEMFKEYPELMKRFKKEMTTKKSGGPIKKLRVGGKVGMTQHQTMACGRKK